MNYQKELRLKTGEEISVHFEIFSGTDAHSDVVKPVNIGKIFNIYFFVEEGTTTPLRIKIQKQLAFVINGEKRYEKFGEAEEVQITSSDEVFARNIEALPIFDRLVVSCSDGIGGDIVHTLLKIL
jgi:hypothetical protein